MVRFLARCALAAACFLSASCFGLYKDLQDLRRGDLTIRVDGSVSRNLVPGVDTTIAVYDVWGSGPDGAAFAESFTGSSLTQQGLALGRWTITVEGRNPDGTIVVFGTADVLVTTGPAQEVEIALQPVIGPGTLALEVSWDPACVQTPSVQGQLVPSQGTAIDLAFVVSAPGEASSTDDPIPNGTYTLVVELLDNSQAIMGAVDVVRIVAGTTTSGSIVFANVDPGTGSISVDITLEMNDPVQVTMSGPAAGLVTGQPMTVAASVPSALGNAVYVWYLNGISIGTGPAMTINDAASSLAPGAYRLDVCAFVLNGARAGSTTCAFTVVPRTAQVALEWDPNTETDLAGYRMYIGTESGVYGEPIEVGLATTFTVTGLLAGRAYYFTVTAYNTAGMESGKSNEVSYTVPGS